MGESKSNKLYWNGEYCMQWLMHGALVAWIVMADSPEFINLVLYESHEIKYSEVLE